jgi:hypothetical protein
MPPLNATPPLTEHDTLPWWVMLLAAPFIFAAVALAPFYVPGPAGTAIVLAGETLALWLGVHSPVPESLKRRPAVAKLIAMASGGGGIATAKYFLPLCTDTRLQAGLWVMIALLTWLAGLPVTFASSGQALPERVLNAAGQA